MRKERKTNIMERMTTQEIISNIEGNGGFDNFNHWDKKEIKTWVKANFPCSDYVAEKVADYLE